MERYRILIWIGVIHHDTFRFPRTIDMHIMSLRQKLGGEGAAIRTIRGVGYRLGAQEK